MGKDLIVHKYSLDLQTQGSVQNCLSGGFPSDKLLARMQ